jgi:hypothetical protein
LQTAHTQKKENKQHIFKIKQNKYKNKKKYSKEKNHRSGRRQQQQQRWRCSVVAEMLLLLWRRIE